MTKSKKVKFIVKKGTKGLFFQILATNGKNLNPADPQKRKASVIKAIASLINHIQEGNYEIVDSTKPVKK